MFEVYASIPERLSLKEIAAYAQRAESMGYNGLHIPDAVHDGLLLSSLALQATTTLKVGTSILVAFPRSPMNVAIAAWDLQAFSGGRFELGLGSQIKANIEQRYSTEWTAPMPRMRDYIASLRAIFHSFQTGERLQFESEHYQFTKLQNFFNPGALDCAPPKIYMGAVGPLMTQLAGQQADGLLAHPTNSHPKYLQQVVLPRIQKGLAKHSRSNEHYCLLAGGLVAMGRDELAVEKMRFARRQLLAFLYSTPAYWPVLELLGWHEVGEQLLQLTRKNQWQQMAELITEEMLDELLISGTYDQLASRIKSLYQGLCNTINIPMPEDTADDPFVAELITELQQA